MDLIDACWQQFRLELHESDSLQGDLLSLLDLSNHLCVMLQRSLFAEVPLSLISNQF